MVPDFEQLRKPVLVKASKGERKISEVVDELAEELNLSDAAREELLPSGKQTRFANRVHWAKSYLKQAGLITNTKWGHFTITERGKDFLKNHSGEMITREELRGFEEFLDFETRTGSEKTETRHNLETTNHEIQTPDEKMRVAYEQINNALAFELIDKIRNETPLFFEQMLIHLLIAMGYGGSEENAGKSLGRTGDGGVDGVIDQDPLGVDQIFIQAKRYSEDNKIGAGAIRDFFGALNIKRATKGIFVTTSSFTKDAQRTAADLGSRIVLIDGLRLSKLMIKYDVGCRTEEVLSIKKIDEDFFDNF